MLRALYPAIDPGTDSTPGQRVVSQPEEGPALPDGGNRDSHFGEVLPEPQLIGSGPGTPMAELAGGSIWALNHQHASLRFDPARATVKISDVVRLGPSHPCTAFDNWSLIPVLEDQVKGQSVTDLIHSFF